MPFLSIDFADIFRSVIEHFTPHSTRELIGTIVGLISMLIALINYIFTDRNKIIVVKWFSNIVNGTNNLLYGKFGPAILNVIALFRETVCFYRGKKKWADSKLLYGSIIAAMFVSPIIITVATGTWHPMELLPAVASGLNCFGIYSKSTVKTKVIVIIVQIIYSVYQGWVGNVAAFITSVIPIVSASVGLIREYNKYKKESKLKSEKEIKT